MARIRLHHCAAATLVIALVPVAACGNVVVSSAATQNVTCSAGVCSPTATSAVLNVGDLETLLASGNVEIITTGAGVQADNIDINAPLIWSSLNGLALAAKQSVMINQPVSVEAAAGMTITTSAKDRLAFGPKGHVAFANLSSALNINGAPYMLVDDVKSLAAAVAANPAGDYALANDYDAAQDGVYQDSPIATSLEGTLEGLGNTIEKLHCKFGLRSGNAGFIAEVSNGGVVENVRLSKEMFRFKKSAQEAGGLVGVNSGLVRGDSVGLAANAPKCCGVYGLVAGNAGGTIEYSDATVRISTEYSGGGLVGENSGSINYSHASGVVQAGTASTGGLVAYNRGYINDSYSTVDVVRGDGAQIGGLTGYDEGETTDSYATGSVSGGANAYVGGLVGYGPVISIADSYSTGLVQGGTSSFVGGFVGFPDSDTLFSDCYWDTNTSGKDQGAGNGNVNGVTGLTTQQFQSGLPAGFDPKTWKENTNINGGLPYLAAIPPGKK